jgi:hypothetical protein
MEEKSEIEGLGNKRFHTEFTEITEFETVESIRSCD